MNMVMHIHDIRLPLKPSKQKLCADTLSIKYKHRHCNRAKTILAIYAEVLHKFKLSLTIHRTHGNDLY